MAYKMKGHTLPGPFQKKIWPPTEKFDIDTFEEKEKKKETKKINVDFDQSTDWEKGASEGGDVADFHRTWKYK